MSSSSQKQANSRSRVCCGKTKKMMKSKICNCHHELSSNLRSRQKKKLKRRPQGLWLSGFFHTQLRIQQKMMKSSKQQQQQRKVKLRSVDNQMCRYSCPVSKKPSLEESSNCSRSRLSSIPLVSTKHLGKNMTSEINYPPILRKHRQRRTIHDLPEDLLANILKLLPVKYILRCRCVQKSWHHLIQTPMFITLQLNYQKTHKHHSPKYLFLRNAFNNKLAVRYDDMQCEEYCTVQYLPALPESIWLVQSHGLICVTSMFDYGSEYDPKIYLWNPLVQKYRTLPNRPLNTSFTFKHTSWTALAFGFVPQVNDYRVVHIVKPCQLNINTVIIGVYSLNTNSWKITSQDNVFISDIRRKQVVFVNGAAFWLGFNSTQKIIMYFDTKTNILREISLPIYARYLEERVNRARRVLHPFGQTISFFVDDAESIHFDMWVLKEDPKNEFLWEKKMSVDLCDLGEDFFREEVLGVRNNGEPICFNLYKFISYNLDSHEANDFVDSWDSWDDFAFYEGNYAPPYDISPFVESLVLLNNDCYD